MFRCQLCQGVVPPRTAAHRLVLQSRTKLYPRRPRANVLVRKPPDEKKKPKKVYVDDPGGSGREAVREVTACPACAATAGVAPAPMRPPRATYRPA